MSSKKTKKAQAMTCEAFGGALLRLTGKHNELYWRVATEAEADGVALEGLSQEQKQATLQPRFVSALVQSVEHVLEQSGDRAEAVDYLEFLTCSILDALYQVGQQDERLAQEAA